MAAPVTPTAAPEAYTPVLPWHSLPASAVLAALASSPDGLRPDEAVVRLAGLGPNALPARSADPWWRILARQFGSVIILLLIGSAALTAVLGRWIDSGAILIAVLVDVILGFTQEVRAARDVAALRSLQVRRAHVRRAGVVVRIEAADIVPGDIVVLESGDRVPADLRLLSATGLRIDESVLTGESVPAVKSTERTPESTPVAEQAGVAWSGTLVVSGRAEGVVFATGARTAVGEIDTLVRESDTPTPLQRVMRRFESTVGIVVGAVALLVLGGGLLLGLGLADAFLNAVALAVAAIPEGLPVVLTIALSVGVSRMARHRAIVRTLPAVEALGSTTVIAADKTGTMTENRMTVELAWTSTDATEFGRDGSPAAPSPGVLEALRIGVASNDAHLDPASGAFIGEPVDAAIAQVARAAGAVDSGSGGLERLVHLPYEPERRCSATVVADADGEVLLVKGAADLVLAASVAEWTPDGPRPLDPERLRRAHDDIAEQGMRVLAVGRRRLQPGEDPKAAAEHLRDLEHAGLLCMTDPPRPGVEESIAACHRAGVSVMMVTGDHPRTAAAIGSRLGLLATGRPVTGRELSEIGDEVLVARLRESRIAARVSPRDKLRIVRALEAAGEVVAVTGDGVNDAPALRAASLGVAMGRGGTDIARDAADIVLTDDDFSTIVRAVRQGRITFAAVQKAAFFLISTGFAALVAVVGDLLVGGPLIFLPVQMIWFNLVSNGLQDVGLAFEGADGDELTRPPRRPGSGLMSRRLWTRIAVTSAWMGLVVLAVFHGALATGAAVDQARTFALTTFAMLNLFQTFNSRSVTRSVFRQSPWSNPFLLVAAIGSLALHIAAVLTPPGWIVLGFAPLTPLQWTLSALLGVSVLVVVEIGKALARHRDRRGDQENGG